MDQPTVDAARGSLEAWLEVAYESLRDAGVDSVRIAALAKKLNRSRTSFYWFFKDRDELLAALLERWRDKNTGNWVKQTEAYAETICEAILNVFDCWLDDRIFDSRFEAAIRSWALQSTGIAAEIQVADQLRIAALTQLFERYEYTRISADARARAIYVMQMGYISMRSEEALSLRMMRIAKYVEVFTGHQPQERELDRFFVRHRYHEAGSSVRGRRSIGLASGIYKNWSR